MDKKVIGVLEYNNATRSEMLSKNLGKYSQYKQVLAPAIGEYYEIRDLPLNSNLGKLSLYEYTHEADSKYASDITKKYFGKAEKERVDVLDPENVQRWGGLFTDYVKFTEETIGTNVVKETYGDPSQARRYITKDSTVGYVSEYSIRDALDGIIQTNTNGLNGDSDLGVMGNAMFSNLLLHSSTVNSMRGRGTLNGTQKDSINKGYITPETYGYYGMNEITIERDDKRFSIDPKTGRMLPYNESDVEIIHDYATSEHTDNGGMVYLDEMLDVNFQKEATGFAGNVFTRTFYNPFVPYVLSKYNITDVIKRTILLNGQFGGLDKNTINPIGNNKGRIIDVNHFEYDENDKANKFTKSADRARSEYGTYSSTNNVGHGNLLSKTEELFRTHEIGTMVGRFCNHDTSDSSVDSAKSDIFGNSHGRNLLKLNAYKKNYKTNNYDNPYCRVWTWHHQYDNFSKLIRPFVYDGKPWDPNSMLSTATAEEYNSFNLRYRSFIGKKQTQGDNYLANNTVLQENGLVKITPHADDFIALPNSDTQTNDWKINRNAKRIQNYMFSLENLAWKDNANTFNLSREQIGPNGGRLMWFPPYDLKFSESVSCSPNQNSFIGRGEKVYTYRDTDRRGTLSFTILIDHPAILNSTTHPMQQIPDGYGDEMDIDADILRFFAGCGGPAGDGRNADGNMAADPSDGIYVQPGEGGGNLLIKSSAKASTAPLNPDIVEYEIKREDPEEPEVPEDENADQLEGAPAKRIGFYVFYPNNYSGNMAVNSIKKAADAPGDKDWWKYLLFGVNIDKDLGERYPKGDVPENVSEDNETGNFKVTFEGNEMTIECYNYAKGNEEELSQLIINKGPYKYKDSDILYFEKDADKLPYIVKCIDEGYKNSETKVMLVQKYVDDFETTHSFGMSIVGDRIEITAPDRFKNYKQFLDVVEIIYGGDSAQYNELVTHIDATKKIVDLINKAIDDKITDASTYQIEGLPKRVKITVDWKIKEYNMTINLNSKSSSEGIEAYGYEMRDSEDQGISDNELNDVIKACKDKCNANYSECKGDFDNGKSDEIRARQFRYRVDFDLRQNHLATATTENIDSKMNSYSDNASFGLNANAEKVINALGLSEEDGTKIYSFAEYICAILKKNPKCLDMTKVFADTVINYCKEYCGVNEERIDEIVSLFENTTVSRAYVRGGATRQDPTNSEELAKRRCYTVRKSILNFSDYTKTDENYKYEPLDKSGTENASGSTNAEILYFDEDHEKKRSINIIEVKKQRCAYVEIELNAPQITNINGTTDDDNNVKKNLYGLGGLNNSGSTSGESGDEQDIVGNSGNNGSNGDDSEQRRLVDTKYVRKVNKKYDSRYDDEYEFFKKLEVSSPVIFKKLKEKYKYFDPAFHSMSPEGFNARLTFLHQCTRQGHTNAYSDSNRTTTANLSFGRMPVCVLKIGDFINSKIMIESLSIQYDDNGIRWDFNPEGAGVQPMLAKVSMNIVYLGGQSLEGPINRLQNAVSFNYYANAPVYDDRADQAATRLASDPNGETAQAKTTYRHTWVPNDPIRKENSVNNATKK